MKRSLRLNFKDGSSKELPIAKATSVKTSKQMLNFDQLEDGNWRVIWNETLIPDISQLMNFEIVREN
jgi:hypothetical protein